MPKHEAVAVRLHKESHDLLKQIADYTGRTMKQVMEILIRRV